MGAFVHTAVHIEAHILDVSFATHCFDSDQCKRFRESQSSKPAPVLRNLLKTLYWKRTYNMIYSLKTYIYLKHWDFRSATLKHSLPFSQLKSLSVIIPKSLLNGGGLVNIFLSVRSKKETFRCSKRNQHFYGWDHFKRTRQCPGFCSKFSDPECTFSTKYKPLKKH